MLRRFRLWLARKILPDGWGVVRYDWDAENVIIESDDPALVRASQAARARDPSPKVDSPHEH